MNSKFLSLNLKDLGKGALLAGITVLVAQLYQSLSAAPPHFPTVADLKADGLMAAAAVISYLLKNLFTNSNGQPLSTEKS